MCLVAKNTKMNVLKDRDSKEIVFGKMKEISKKVLGKKGRRKW